MRKVLLVIAFTGLYRNLHQTSIGAQLAATLRAVKSVVVGFGLGATSKAAQPGTGIISRSYVVFAALRNEFCATNRAS